MFERFQSFSINNIHFSVMNRRVPKSKSWKTRLSAGGANRTSLHGQMSRYPEVAEDYLIMQPSIRRSSGSDLMPVARFNNFKRWNSCLQHVESQPEGESSDF